MSVRQSVRPDVGEESPAAKPQEVPGNAPDRVYRDPGSRALAVLRFATGFVFLWAFLDKMFGLGYATAADRAWINGGSPTKGFLANVKVGLFQDLFNNIAGAWWANILFMLGLGAIGLAVMLGVALWPSAIAGTLMMLLMWAAEWPFAQFASDGSPSGSTNPFMDYHVIYALALIVAAATYSGRTFGLGRWWEKLVGGTKYLV
jgi:thiosulfate dehydrogenase [quinone] large subunit